MDLKLAPSLLSADFACLNGEMAAAEAGGAEMLHIDVMDGDFVPNITFGPDQVKALRPHTGLVFDVHMMVWKPGRFIERFVEAGADIITVHAEACTHLDRVLEQIRQAGVKAGAALNPATPPEVLRYCLNKLSLILVMTVNPGYGGQQFIPEMIEKISEVRDMIKTSGREIDLEVDGGIKTHNVQDAVRAGANVIVAGSAVFGKGETRKRAETMVSLMRECK